MSHELDDALRGAYARLLAAHVPGYVSRRLRWARGEADAVDVGEGSPLLLLHGGMGDLLHWLPLMPALARSHRVIAVDRPGQGLSEPFPYDASTDILEHATEFLRGILDDLGLPRATLVGNSMGGLWSVAFALRHPDRVERLVLVGAPAGSKRWIPGPARVFRIPLLRRIVRAAISRGGVEATRNAFGRILVAHPERLEEDLIAGMALATRRNLASTWGLWESVLTPWGFLRPHLVIGDRWRELAVPVTFVWGEKDAFDTPEHGAELARLVPAGGRLFRVPDAGHLPWLDEPACVAEHVLSAMSVVGSAAA
jgi:pimeloyl-ACP methyl ester carboxylesterase